MEKNTKSRIRLFYGIKNKRYSMNEVFETALEIAVRAHKGQVDKNGVAYILHPLVVAGLLETLELKTIAV